MTLEDKLEKFKFSAVDNATRQSAAIIEDYEKTVKSQFEDYKSQAYAKADNTLKVESANLIKKKNQMLTKEILESKRLVNNKSTELTDNLFSEVDKKLQNYKKGSEYKKTLLNEIEKVKTMAKDSPITIYIDSNDSSLKEQLEKESGVSLTISDIEFNGGIRAIIHDRNILIDESFATKLAEERSKFSL